MAQGVSLDPLEKKVQELELVMVEDPGRGARNRGKKLHGEGLKGGRVGFVGDGVEGH